MRCGCSLQRPECAVGKRLFAALMQASQRVALLTERERAQQWEQVHRARRAYVDHVWGWRQGDVRVRYEEGRWCLERREREQWVFRVVGREEAALHAWLKEQGFWRYAQLDGDGQKDRLTGYYHQRTTSGEQARSPVASAVAQTLPKDAHRPSQEAVPLEHVLRPELDLKTQLALVIAVLVGRETPPLTPGDRLSIQRKAVEWLLVQGVPLIREDEVKTITILIEEAICIRDSLPPEEHR